MRRVRFRKRWLAPVAALAVAAVVVPAALAITIHGSLTNTDPTQTGRVFRDGVASTCDSPKANPGLANSNSVSYDAYTFSNSSGSTQCVSVQLTTSGCGINMFTVAYTSFDPAHPSANYLADAGASSATRSFSLNVPAHTSFEVVASGTTAGVGCDYTLDVTGTGIIAGDAPVTTITLNPASPNGSNGWYTSSSVGVTVSATDLSGSGIAETRCALDPASVPASFADLPSGACSLTSVSGEGTHTIYAASKDNDGNVESPVVSQSLMIDSKPPTLSPTVSPNPLFLHASGSASPNASDATSGVASAGCGPLDTSAAGDHTVTCSASDNAGNGSTTIVHYTVQYRILPFFPQPSVTTWTAGHVMPVKVTLADVNSVPISTAEAAGLVSPVCRIKFSATGVQTVNPSCMTNSGFGQFFYSWAVGAATGPDTFTITITYANTNTTTTRSQSITIN